jgi:hypothetical protein
MQRFDPAGEFGQADEQGPKVATGRGAARR